MSASVVTRGRLEGLRARIAANPLLVDALIALGLTLLSLITLAGGAQDFGQSDPFSLASILLQTLPLALRRRFPLAVLLVTAGATIGHVLFATAAINVTLGSLIALFTVAERYDRRSSAVAALALAVALSILIWSKAGLQAGLSSLVQTQLSVFVAWLLGTWSRERRRYVGTVEERALRAERDREERAERAVAEERERIARELHDVVTHHVSVIVIQAGAGLRSLDTRPDDAREALRAIDGSARRALADMRRLLGILGRPGGGLEPARAGADDPLSPMPGLDRLGELLENVRAAGLPVELSVAGEPRSLDPGIELSAYRIIQEALTNTLKHARGARARVDIRYELDAIDVRVSDEGGAGGGATGVPEGLGRGLIGMRERVAMFGGRFEAGRTGTGFHVAARLPLDPEAAATA